MYVVFLNMFGAERGFSILAQCASESRTRFANDRVSLVARKPAPGSPEIIQDLPMRLFALCVYVGGKFAVINHDIVHLSLPVSRVLLVLFAQCSISQITDLGHHFFFAHVQLRWNHDLQTELVSRLITGTKSSAENTPN